MTKNIMSGSAGNVVQAGTVRDVHFHSPWREVPPPFQLPPAPRCFVNREAELAAIRLGDLVVLSGPGGVGKTSLALRWLQDRRSAFPDGQLYADLGAHAENGPGSPEDVLEGFLHALGVGEIPPQLARRAALFRSVTDRRRLSLLLDNVASAAQVRPLLPASGTVVITSRWRLSPLGLDGARFVDVAPMNVEESIEFFETVVGPGRLAREPDAVREVARLCGGLPIALSVVGARLSTRPRRTFEREVVDLRDDRLPELDESASVRSVLDLSYVDLPERQARLYRLCAWHPGAHFDVSVAAAMIEEPEYDVEDALEDLVEKSLLSEAGDDRFRYHDLLRVHARSKADPGGEAAVRRAVEWYLTRAVEADHVVAPDSLRTGPVYASARKDAYSTPEDAMDWLVLERENLVRAVEVAPAELRWQLCEPLWALFTHHHLYNDWISTYRLGVAAAGACGELVAQARLRTKLALALINTGALDEAVSELEAVLELDDPPSRSTALTLLGRVCRERGEPERALELYRAALALRTRDRGRGQARRRIGEALVELGRYPEAIAELELADSLLAEAAEQARTRTFLARACRLGGQPERARALLDSALDRLSRSPMHLADVHLELAELADDPRPHRLAALACYHDETDPQAVRIQALLDQDGGATGVVPQSRER
ncbi:ATP-binding protein [Lentzea jiangxiensis]|uniref:Tetratricopeptide repeat-containing protein n=1 Tax=Lentzea jiangxiensis TaxID=641025 RepID=A0A1H0WGQ7_9PSEU|nr:tetratricopeptide repeat protein [Lentzea jiangxiensis]SDP89743.1 Tetratricopeptide repeat-containing protein [Lentzea jiangxiensis]